ncbi:hypothetical protein [Geothrix sp. PMB-07]|uniref:hypothetical protein n=1 Tax=Geothrix sp. PMB-07 TaxID=3068640 RepID=UPI0027420449|nr:hypothetical protein [Geothrix sp. PMB-07]WLT31684.1 hypothetical protein Q9293_18430 [Geothrix sp. PMB-07]
MSFRTAFSALVLLAVPLCAGDFDALAKSLRQTWPNCTTVMVVCDVANSKGTVEAASSAFSGVKVMVVDVKGPQDIGRAAGAVTTRHPDAVLLLPSDKVVSDGSSAASFLIQRLGAAKIPVICTSEAGVRQGAVFATGPSTGGKVFANAKAAGVAGVSVPAGATNI